MDQQIEEREAADKERKAADEAYKAAVIARDERAIELDIMEKQCRKQLLRACCTFNKALVGINSSFLSDFDIFVLG